MDVGKRGLPRAGKARGAIGWASVAALSLILAGCAVAVPTLPPAPATPTLTLGVDTPTSSPSATAPVPTPCPETEGQVRRLTYPGRVVSGDIALRVYVPPCYESSGLRYPVIYLLHGKPYTESHWDDLGVSEAVDQALAAEAWPPVVLVMPLQPEPVFTNSDGGPWSYEEEMIEGLVPFVDQAFRTLADGSHRAIAGISRGGVWALEIAFRNPSVFDAVAALSPALAVNNARPAYDPMEIARTATDLPNRIYLGAGEDDWARRMTERLAQALEAGGVPFMLTLVPGDHQAPTWQAALLPMLAYLVEPW